jgi:murein DD-endopeptidase MepM/ murein hydrolase activator NlpD
MATFPFAHRPKESYKERPRSFGSPRNGGKRKHAGCDLYVVPGTEVLAVEDGVVVPCSPDRLSSCRCSAPRIATT